jgi:hypothetical protein
MFDRVRNLPFFIAQTGVLEALAQSSARAATASSPCERVACRGSESGRFPSAPFNGASWSFDVRRRHELPSHVHRANAIRLFDGVRDEMAQQVPLHRHDTEPVQVQICQIQRHAILLKLGGFKEQREVGIALLDHRVQLTMPDPIVMPKTLSPDVATRERERQPPRLDETAGALGVRTHSTQPVIDERSRGAPGVERRDHVANASDQRRGEASILLLEVLRPAARSGTIARYASAWDRNETNPSVIVGFFGLA